MAISILDELKTHNKVSFELDLGFSLYYFQGSYRKTFHVASYVEFNVNFRFTKEKLQLFNIFYNEILEYGTKSFLIDLSVGYGEKEYEFLETPKFSHVENDLYNVTVSLLQKNTVSAVECIYANNCINNLLSNLKSINTVITSKIQASVLKKQGALCMLNLINNVEVDLNDYREQKILI